MKKILFCLSIGMVATGCQNGTIVHEGEIRTHFQSYCKLSGGTPDGSNVCICGNYRCYERACNHTGDRCDDRMCYTGDTKCTNGEANKLGTIQICKEREYKDIDTNTESNINIRMEGFDYDNKDVFLDDKGQCTISQNGDNRQNTSCGKNNHSWEATCGICLDGATCKEGESSDFNATVSLCESGTIAKTITCDSDKCEENHCQKCNKDTFEEYCENTNNIGHKYTCNNNNVTANECTNASCNADLTGCGECLNDTPQCVQLNDTNYYIFIKCKNGEKPKSITTQAIINDSNFKLYANPGCSDEDWITCPVCISINDTETPIFYTCKEDKCTIASCAEKCDLAHGCGTDNLEYDYTGCSNPSIKSCTCRNDVDCKTNCDVCKETSCICQSSKCVASAICNGPSNDCPGMNRCAQNGACITNCGSNNQCTGECDTLKCNIGNREAEVYCFIQSESELTFPFILYKEGGSELHIDSDNFFLLRQINKFECSRNISTIVLHGDPNNNSSFNISCEDLNSNGSITLPSNITKIIGYKDSPIIQCKDNHELNVPLFNDVDSKIFEDFGIHITFTPASSEPSADLRGGLANELINSPLKNIKIAGKITCSSDNCGLLAGTVSDTKLIIEGIDGENLTVIPNDDKNKLTNIGGVIGYYKSSQNGKEIQFNNIHINKVEGTNNVGGFIGSIGCESIGNCTDTLPNITITGKGNTLTETVNGMTNVGGVVGAASGSLHVKNFDLNKEDDNKNPYGAVIGGNLNYDPTRQGNDYQNAYKAENIGGLIGKLYVPENAFIKDIEDTNLSIYKIENIIIKLSTVTCSEYMHRSEFECSDSSCNGNELCNTQSSQCKYGGGLIGFMDIREIASAKKNVLNQISKFDTYTDDILETNINVSKSQNTIIDFSNILLVLNTLSISRYYAGLVGFLGDDPEDININTIKDYINGLKKDALESLAKSEIYENELINIHNNSSNDTDYQNNLRNRLIYKFTNTIKELLRHKYGVLSIKDVLIAINEVDGRLDIFGRFRGFTNNIKVLTKLEMSKIFALIKLNDNSDKNYCLYKGEYDGTLISNHEDERKPCLISSPETASNINCNSDPKSKFSCLNCVSKYLENYNFFLVYPHECRFTDGDGYFTDDTGIPYDRFCFIDNESLFTQSENYDDPKVRDLSEDKVKKQSVYFYQFKHYSTYYRPTYYSYDEDGTRKSHKHYDVAYGQCIAKDNVSNNYMCAYLQNDCSTSINIYCCDSNTGGKCNNNTPDVCANAPSTTHYQCSDFHVLNNFHWAGSDTFYIEEEEITLPTPIIP